MMFQLDKKILMWLDPATVEPDALQQIRNVSELPFIFRHVAVMPDCHYGKGATIGTVIATKGAIVPAATGVDIGCLAGDTLIPCLDGKEYTIKSLAENAEPVCVYAATPTGEIVATWATAKKTRQAVSLVEVVLDNNRSIRCTPDHEFMLRNGNYEEGARLKPRQSLMPFYARINKDGHVAVRQPFSSKEQHAHRIVALSGLMGEIKTFDDQKTVIHHRDFCETNNLPENLEFMGARDHSRYHRLLKLSSHWQSPEFERRRLEGIARRAKDPNKRQKMREVGVANITAYMKTRPEHYAASVAGNGKRGSKYLKAYHERRAALRVASQNNHRVKTVRNVTEIEDVYCLTVPKYGNFAISAGVFVHNCGMTAVRTPLKRSDIKDVATVRTGIERRIPMSAGVNNSKITDSANMRINELECVAVASGVRGQHYTQIDGKWPHALGTLGGGNHFIELAEDENGDVWATLHSGSRGIGNRIGNMYIRIAQECCRKWHIKLPDRDLAYLVSETEDYHNYWRDLRWAQLFAKLNRDEMMNRVMLELSHTIHGDGNHTKELELERVTSHHNYTTMEHHFGEDVLITRKGAICARKGMLAMIPGSMGTRSYIVEGLENPLSFHSAPHGAGRRMSRTKARASFTWADLDKAMDGIEFRRAESLIDEIPGAYKDLDVVMENAKELVRIRHTLKQFLNCKGD